MVVTGSRLEAMRYKREFDRHQREGLPIKSLVAFSGAVEDDKDSGEDLHRSRHELGPGRENTCS